MTITPPERKRAFICSPYGDARFAGPRNTTWTWADLTQRMARWAILKGYAPFAPHGYYPAVLYTCPVAKRLVGMECGMAWLKAAEVIIVWVEAAPTPGMIVELEMVERLCSKGRIIERIDVREADLRAAGM